MDLQAQIDEVMKRVDQLAASPLESASVTAPEQRLSISRSGQNDMALSIGGNTVTLTPADLSGLIDALAEARVLMQPEPPTVLPAGWRYVATKDPVVASRRDNGETLLVLRHTGYGWVPFTFSPNMVVQLLARLTGQTT